MAEKEPPKDPPDLKVVQGGARRRGHVTIQIYTALRELYVVKGFRTIRGLGRESGISLDTCQKAVTFGWPERNWPPLRELAAQFDAEAVKAAQAKSAPTAETVVIEAMQFKKIRHENLEMALVLRSFIKRMTSMVYDELPNATLYRQGTQVRVIDVDIGKPGKPKIIQRVVKENVRLPPYLPDMMRAVSEAMQAAKVAGDAERLWARFIPPEGEGNIGWDSLTDEQLDEIEKNEGRLPEGWTLESLRRRS